MRNPLSIDDLMKAAQAAAEEETSTKQPGEKTDEEMEKEEKQKAKDKAETPSTEETKTSSLVHLADSLRATAVWLDKQAGGGVPFSEPTDGGGVTAGGQVTIEPEVTGEQPHPSPTPMPDHDATKTEPLGPGGGMKNTMQDPLTTQTQAEPGSSTAMETGKTTSGPTKSQPIAAEQAKVSHVIKALAQQKLAATPQDVAPEPGGNPPGPGGMVGYTEPTDQSNLLQNDAAATNMTPQQAEDSTQKPDLRPLLQEQPETHAEGGDGTPNVDSKLAWYQRLSNIMAGR
jgi:hypothetical protein